MIDTRRPAALAAFFVIFLFSRQQPAAAQSGEGIRTEGVRTIKATSLAMHGEPHYKAGFTHFDYVNPAAPKGGSITHYSLGTFDNFHRYALRGNFIDGYQYFYDTLMVDSGDDIGAYYPLVAESVEYAADYSFIIYTINPAARANDGLPITAEDVAFSFNIIFEKGVPQFRAYYKNVKATVLDKQHVRFDMGTTGDKELMLGTAQFAVFPKRFWQSDDGTVIHDFAEPLVTPPLGTGAYRVKDYAMGQFVILERVKDYWAADLPVNKGRYNFDTIRYDCYRDANVAFEAFKAGEYDFRNENSAKNWAVEYKGKVFETGAVVREELPHSIPSVMQALVFNTQRPIFADRRVRAALNYFFDFEWMNKNLFYNQYERSRSFFGNTDYEARGLPSLPEREILEPFRSRLPEEVFTREYRPPVSDGTGYVREGARAALKLFEEAGWQLKKGKLINNESGAQFSFELLIYDTSTERFAVPFQRVLSRYGIDMKIRMVDTSQYVNRLRSRDFDMLPSAYGANPYPSTNLMISWHSGYIESSYNTAGVIDPVVDNLIEQIMASQADEDKLLALGRALDRVLTWNYYVIPEWGISKFRIAYKNKLARPERRPKYALDIDSWWVK